MVKAVLATAAVIVFALLVWGSINAPTCTQKEMRAQAEATRLAIENEKAQVELEVEQGAASARIAAAQTVSMGAAIACVLFLFALAVVVPLWLYNRASMAYAKQGLYPIVVRPGLRGVAIYDANRLPGTSLQVTSQAQAIQLAASLAQGDMTAHERSGAMQEIGRAFQPARSSALLDPPIVQSTLTASHVERLLLEGGDNDDNR